MEEMVITAASQMRCGNGEMREEHADQAGEVVMYKYPN